MADDDRNPTGRDETMDEQFDDDEQNDTDDELEIQDKPDAPMKGFDIPATTNAEDLNKTKKRNTM